MRKRCPVFERSCEAGGQTRLRIEGSAYELNAAIRRRISSVNDWSLREVRLISTLARAPVIAAWARAEAVVRSDFMFGFETDSRDFAICAISWAFSATLRGTDVASFRAASIRISPDFSSAAERAALYAFITESYD